MSRAKLLAGVAGLSLVLGAPAFAQQAASGCSGLACLFGQSISDAESKALEDNQKAAEMAAAAEAGRGKADDSTGAKSRKGARAVTIAADGPEAKRLAQLVAALPKEKIRIVKAKGDRERTAADFAVTTVPKPGEAAEQAKLFTEQLHIVAGASVKSVADLEDKVVSFGPDKSEGQIAARRAFEALHVKVNETPLDIDNALDGLSTGDVAAVVILAPQPIERLKSVSEPGVHLISWPEGGSLPDGASTVTIETGDYPTLAKPGDKIRAVGIEAVLVANAKGAKQTAAKSFLKSISDHADTLTKHGFDLLKADLAARSGRRVASADKS